VFLARQHTRPERTRIYAAPLAYTQRGRNEKSIIPQVPNQKASVAIGYILAFTESYSTRIRTKSLRSLLESNDAATRATMFLSGVNLASIGLVCSRC
jgi:hypothetical protein